MKLKLFRYAAVALVLLAACQEEEISPSLSQGNLDKASAGKGKAHLKALSRGLIAYYPFSGNANDQSGNGLHGTVNGATLTTDRHGVANAAYYFGGDDHISVADNDLLDFQPGDDFTISLWVEVAATQNLDGGINDILRKWQGDAQGYPFSIAFLNEGSADPERILLTRYSGQACGEAVNVFSNPVSRQVFHHVVMTKNGSTLSLYINGVLVSSEFDPTVCSTANDSHMTIGSRGQLARFFTGKIDDIRIYDRALSSREISWLKAV